MLADGGECVSDLATVRDQEALFGPVASDWTASRVAGRVASRARTGARALVGASRHPERLTIDVNATPITSHSEKEKAAGTYMGALDFIRSRSTQLRRARRWAGSAHGERGREHTHPRATRNPATLARTGQVSRRNCGKWSYREYLNACSDAT